MKKRWLLMLTILLVIVIPFVINDLNESDSEVWIAVENQEWENFENGTGTGMYFYEENNKKYCLFMVYGSGVYVAGHHKSEVKLVGNSKLEIEAPELLVELNGKDQTLHNYQMELEHGKLMLGENIYEASEKPGKYKHIISKR